MSTKRAAPELERPEYALTGTGSWPGGARFPWIRLRPLSKAERDAMPTPVPDGVLIFNATAGKVQVRVDGAWLDL
jgi:hypothetical protein